MSNIDKAPRIEARETAAVPSRRKRSVTQEMGRDAFEKALSLSRERDDASEVGYAASFLQPRPQSRVESGAARSPQAGSESPGAAPAPTRSDHAGAQGGVAESDSGVEAMEADENVDSRLDETSSAEAEGEPLENAVEESTPSLEIEPAVEAEPEAASAEPMEASAEEISELESQSTRGGEDAENQAESEPSDEQELSAEIEWSEELDAVEAEFSDFESGVPSSKDAETNSVARVSSNSSLAAPVTFVEAWGKQAFAKATTLHRSGKQSAPSQVGSVDLEDLADQIAKARGTMSGGRARIVVGEGSERVALTVLLRNGTVSLDARAADAALAENLARSSGELAEALGRHGLALGDMATGSDREAEAREWATGEGSAPRTEHESEDRESTLTHRPGVRVVA